MVDQIIDDVGSDTTEKASVPANNKLEDAESSSDRGG